MYRQENNQIEDEIVIDIDGRLNKMKRSIHKRRWMLMITVIVTCLVFVFGQKMLHKNQYQGYVTYMVNYVRDEGTDAFVASMLGSHIDTVYVYGGLKEMLKQSLEQRGASSDWLEKDSLSTYFDSTTNLLTIYGNADAYDKVEVLMESVRDIIPAYAVERFNDIMLVSMDENVGADPVNAYSQAGIVMIGCLLGLFLAGMIVVYASFANKMIYSREDMRRITQISQIGELPRVEKRKSSRKTKNRTEVLTIQKINKHNQKFAESIRTLRYRTMKMMDSKQEKILLVISSVPGEGKTTVSINLALAMAETGKKVLLIDSDIYRASIKNSLRLVNCRYTLMDYLKGNKSAEEIITEGPSIDVIAGEVDQKLSAHGLSEGKMNALLDALREAYDYIVIDTAPTVIRSDAEILSTMADAFVYVVRCDDAEQKTVEKGLASLVNKPIHCLGYVLNDVDDYSGSYSGKYYRYNYH